MTVFKNITSLKELEKNRASQKMSKLAYYQVTHELLTPVSGILPLLEIIKNKIDP